MLKEFMFGSEAIIYIREELSEGRTLSSLLLHLPLEDGRVIAYLPEETTRKASLEFRIGSARAGGVRRISDIKGPGTDDFIAAFLSGQSRRQAVFEDAWARPDDPFLQLPRHRFVSHFFHECEVYHFLTASDFDPKRIAHLMMASHQYPSIGILTSLPENEPSIQDRQIVKRETLEILAMRAEHIIVGAYDLEGELIWSRPGVSLPHL